MRKIWKTTVPGERGRRGLYLVTSDEAIHHDLQSPDSLIRAYPHAEAETEADEDCNPHRDLALGAFFAYLAEWGSGQKLLVKEIEALPEGLKQVNPGKPGRPGLIAVLAHD